MPGADDADGAPVFAFRADRLQQLAAAGRGVYVEANYTDSDTRAILGRIEAAHDKARAAPESVRIWEERFYIPALALAFSLLPFFRRGASLPVIALAALLWFPLFFPAGNARAGTAADLFLNRDQQARAAYEKGDYKDAMAKFDTPYRRGVAAYRAGAYDKAAMLFQAASRKGDLKALYDLGNSQLMQGRVEDAVASYETVLRQKPDDVGARHNLAIALKLLEQPQKKDQKPQDNKDKDAQNKQQSKNGAGSEQQGQQRNNGGQGRQDNARNPPQTENRDSQRAGRSKDEQKSARQQRAQGKAGQSRRRNRHKRNPRGAESRRHRTCDMVRSAIRVRARNGTSMRTNGLAGFRTIRDHF